MTSPDHGPAIGSLFSGTGGLDDAVTAVLGGRVVWHCDNDPAATTVLAQHHPDVPNLGDITTVDWSRVSQIDVLTGGFPCQDISTAGQQAGMRPGTRSGLWTHMAHAISVLRPRLVVIENVRGILSVPADSGRVEPCPWCVGDRTDDCVRALGAVLADLADLGYDAAWCGLRAADVGAPHGRFRVFVAAADTHRPIGQLPRQHASGPTQDAQPEAIRGIGRGGDPPAADPHTSGPQRPEPTQRRHLPAWSLASHSDRQRPVRSGNPRGWRTGPADRRHAPAPHDQPDWHTYTPAVRRWEHLLGRPAPAATVPGHRTGRRLNPAFVEWLMGLPAGRVTDVPDLSRADMLRLLGNGVVPQQGAAALTWLLPHLTAPANTSEHRDEGTTP